MNQIKCCAKVWDGHWSHNPCKKRATVEREGKAYCTIHDPVRKAEKQKEQSEKWQLKHEREMKDYRKAQLQRQLYPKAIEAMRSVVAEWDDNEIGQIDGATIDVMRKIIEEESQ